MRPWTLRYPKALIQVKGKPLIQYQIERLRNAGIQDLVINCGHLGAQVEAFLGKGGRFGVRVRYSREGPNPLGTGAGALRALKWLGRDPFILINADIWHNYPLKRLRHLSPHHDAKLILVPNPPQHPNGDFSLHQGTVGQQNTHRVTYAGLALCHPRLFRTRPPRPHFELAPLLHTAALSGRIAGELHQGDWIDLGAPARINALRHALWEGTLR